MKRLRRSIHALGFAILIAIPIAGISDKVHAQLEVVPAIRFGIVSPDVREFLAAEWDRHLADDPYLERGYCGYVELGMFAGEEAYIVVRVTPADTVIGKATTTGVDFRCYGTNAIPIHVHPPRNCPLKDGPCTKDGLYAYQCMASRNDRSELVLWDFPFGVLQCERKALRTFWPVGIAGI